MSTAYWSTVRSGDEAAPEEEASTSSSRKRPPDSPEFGHWTEDREKRIRRPSRGKTFSQIEISGDARAHVGDVYVSGDYHGSARLHAGGEEDRMKALREWLHFPRQEARREQIKPAHQETFGWIFSDTLCLNDAAVTFAEWLRSGDGLFWIKGKAGSGKSTLMKMLSQDARTNELLQHWSAGKPVIVPSFYFWNTGTDMQKSILGLLRSLLCDILEKYPALGAAGFPAWQPRFNSIEPTLEEAMAAFLRIIDAVDCRVCLFIDGLDEFEGSEIDKTELTKLIIQTTQRSHIKAVISSRPLRVFESSFRPWPWLAIHYLTKKDIESMVSAELEAEQYFCQLRERNQKSTRKMVEEIASRASGVFLWAVWVIKILLDGCRHREEIEELEERLNELPQELEQLFVVMLDRIPPNFQKEGYRYLKLALFQHNKYWKGWGCSLDASTLALAEDVESTSSDFWNASVVSEYIDAKTSRLRARLHTATQGLLEEQGASIEFMHKSVIDFLDQHMGKAFTRQQASSFDSNAALMLALALQLRVEAEDPDEDDMYLFFLTVREAERVTGVAQTMIIDEVHRHLMERPEWDIGMSCEYFERAIELKCKLYVEDKLRKEGAQMLRNYPDLLSDTIFSTGGFTYASPDEQAHYLSLWMCSLTDTDIKIPMSSKAKRNIEMPEQLELHLRPWEMALLDTHGCLRQRQFFHNYQILLLVVDMTPRLSASCALSEAMMGPLDDFTSHEPTAGGLLHHVLDARCPAHPVTCEGDASLTIASCACVVAEMHRQEIRDILKKLEDRETSLRDPSTGQWQRARIECMDF